MLDADAVVVATEAWAASLLLADVDAEVARRAGAASRARPRPRCRWRSTRKTSGSTSTRSACCAPWPRSARSWRARCPRRSGRAARRRARRSCAASSAGRTTRRIMENDDETITAIVDQRVPRDPRPEGRRPVWTRVFRWTNGMPQYTLGHLDRVALIERAPRGDAGPRHRRRQLHAASACRTASRAARPRPRKVLADLGVTLAEDSAEEKRYY